MLFKPVAYLNFSLSQGIIKDFKYHNTSFDNQLLIAQSYSLLLERKTMSTPEDKKHIKRGIN